MSDGIERIRAALQKEKRLHAWELRRVRTAGVQIYLLAQGHEAERRVNDDSYNIALHVLHDDVQGRASFRLQPGEETELEARIDEAIYMAGLGGDQPYDLAGPSPLPDVPLSDTNLTPESALTTARGLSTRWVAAVSALKDARPSSGELFSESVETTLENSAGFRGQAQSSKLSLLTIVLAGDGTREAERISWEERRRATDLDVEGIVNQAAVEARDLVAASLPPTSTMPVVIDSGELVALFSPIVRASSGQALFQKSTRFQVGQPLPGVGDGGQPLTLMSNAVAPYGLSSYAFDGDGLPGRRLEIVSDGIFRAPWVSRQYAAYTKLDATGDFANLELAPGIESLDELLSDGPVLYIKAFSWLTPDASRGDFSSEIRIGYLVDKKGRRPIKGGSVSGNLFAALSNARFAKETVSRGSYIGPRALRFEGLTVTGA